MAAALASSPDGVSTMTSTTFWARSSPIPGGDIHSPGDVGGLSISYANVATYEVGFGGQAVRPRTCVVVPIIVSNPVIILDSNIVDEISTQVEDYSSTSVIFCFRGFWPSLSDLHASISKFWEPLVSDSVQIFPMVNGFFIVKIASMEDRNAIIRHGFSWEERFPLMAKPWYSNFDLSIESFNKIPLWVRLPNLPLHLWLDLILEAMGEALGIFDSASSNVFQMTYAHILVEIDVSKGLLEMIKLASPIGS